MHAPPSREDRPDRDVGVVRVRERDVALRRVAVNDLSISEAKRDAPSLEERACLPRAEHRIDSRTGVLIIVKKPLAAGVQFAAAATLRE